jgi:HEAT repeats
MISETTQQQIIDYIEGNLSDTDRNMVETMLSTNADTKIFYEQIKQLSIATKNSTEWKPSKALRESFDSMLEKEIEYESKRKYLLFNSVVYKVAASLTLLVIATSIAFWYMRQVQKDTEIAALRKEMETTRALVFSLLQNDQSASQRIMGVRAAYQTTRRDNALVLALIKTMNDDANMNVRLAAVEALGKFSGEEMVRTALIESLSKQLDPVVQIALIQVFVQMKEKEALLPLQKMSEDKSVLESVRNEAHAGIIKLNV